MIQTFDADSRPAIEVCVGARWLPGTLRAWIERDRDWWAHIDYTIDGARTYTTTVPACRIRSDDLRAEAPGWRRAGVGTMARAAS